MSSAAESSYRFDLSDMKTGERIEIIARPVTRGSDGAPRRTHKRMETFRAAVEGKKRLGKFCDADYCIRLSGDFKTSALLRDDRRLIEESGTEWHVDEVRWLGG